MEKDKNNTNSSNSLVFGQVIYGNNLSHETTASLLSTVLICCY